MSKSITDLRDTLFATLEGVKNGTLDIDKARAVNEVAKTIVDTAKVEIDYARVVGKANSPFIEPPKDGVTRHRLT